MYLLNTYMILVLNKYYANGSLENIKISTFQNKKFKKIDEKNKEIRQIFESKK